MADLPIDPFGQQPVGNGPYRLLAWNAGEATLEAVLTRLRSTLAARRREPPDASRARPRRRRRAGRCPASTGSSSASTPTRPSLRRPSAPATSPAPAASTGDRGARSRRRRVRASLRYPRSTLTTVAVRPAADPDASSADARTRKALLAGGRPRRHRRRPSWPALGAPRRRPDPAVVVGLRREREHAARLRPRRRRPEPRGRRLDAAPIRAAGSRPGRRRRYTLELLAPDRGREPGRAAAVAAAVADGLARARPGDHGRGAAAGELVERLRAGDFAAAVVDVNVGLDPDPYPLLASIQTLAGGRERVRASRTRRSTRSPRRRPAPGTRRRPARRPTPTSSGYLADASFDGSDRLARRVVSCCPSRVAGPTVRRLGDAADRFYDVLTWRLANDR